MQIMKVDSNPISPIVKPIANSMLYSLDQKMEVSIDSAMLIVPKGFTTDGASIPRIFWFTTGTPFSPHYMRGAIIHDYLYQTGMFERKLADRVMYHFILNDNTSKYNATKIYCALRIAGWYTWNRYRKMEKNNLKSRNSHITYLERTSMIEFQK
jgi:hypothetical protein